mmetsp:Transcript_7509/g.33408  ORF Transcript_7509/g.33408 Transcript_7509/m.33408 type:complete len:569 (-) Transcript_7509:3527-5233(-)
MNPTCAWVKQDLVGYARELACPPSREDELGQCEDLCTCRSAGTIPLCRATDESCTQSNQTIEWILQEFRNTPVSSTEMLAQDTLEKLANQTFESAIKLGSLISTTPVKTVEAWASANVPGLESKAGRGQQAMSFAQGIMDLLKNFTRIALRDGIFDSATAAEKAIYQDGANDQNDDDDWFGPFVEQKDLWYGPPKAALDGLRGENPQSYGYTWHDLPCDNKHLERDGYYNANPKRDGVYWETYTYPDAATGYMEINEMLKPEDNDPSNSYILQDPCNRYYRKCYYDCSFNGQTFTDWDGDYANIPSWVPYDKTQNNNGDLHTTYQTMDYYPGYTMPGLTCTKTREGPLWRNDFERNTQGAVPSPPWPEYRFNQSRNWGCDAYSVSLDTAYFLYDTPERFLLIKNASWDAMDKNIKDKAKAAGKPEPQFDGWGPGSGIDYVAKFAIPIMKRHGTVRNAISNLFIDEKVVSVNYEDYFNTCAITTCTYTYSARLSTAALTSVIFGLIGGIVAFMNLFGGFVYDACKAAVLRGAEEATGRESSHEDETGREAPHEHESKGSDAPAVPKSRA